MHLIFCDETFGIISNPIDDFESLVWTQRWYDPGSFTLILKNTHFSVANAAAFIYNFDLDDYMIVEEVEIDSESNMLTVKGSSLEAMFDWRTFTYPTYYTGQNVEIMVRGNIDFLTTNIVSAEFAFVQTPIIKSASHNYTQTGDMYIKAGTLLSDAIRFIYKPYGWTYTLKKEYGTSNIIFDTVVGKDRRSTQSVNGRAMFATTTEDISSWSYSRNKKDYKNFAVLNTVWAYDSATETANGSNTNNYDASVGSEENRFAFLTGDTDYTAEQMDALCVSELLKYPIAETAHGDISPLCRLVYGANYKLGDICDFVVNEIGLMFSARITAVDFVYEKSAKRIIPIFGEEKLNPRKFIKREAGK